ncbi:SPFH domain-containing protein [Rudaeicoccus suwonensis]|uniref:Membrane protease subunit (Stomatin/prohibitin family) n=1 Tax=Rudaeicoccus suwonensis TaxID=657409 RepID=A0A561DWZ2_9MICO|nr:SPFH domain-containing protein [Rudaeicoccus suwonensis]TWE07852.1 membrane protease subunit (stomatin/prohibitin family) [Rudaeicoccus suwonensis]
MGLMDKIRGELVDIIEWVDDSHTALAWRFPRYNNEIKNGAKLIVREGQEAVFVHNGQLADRFGPGMYELTTENLPIISTLQGWQYGFNSPFRSEVYFINTRPVTDFRWGTANPITVRDPDFKMVQVRANGLCVVRVVDPAIFLRQVIGTDSQVQVEEIGELLRRVITLALADMVMQTGLGVIDLQGKQVELADKLRDFVAARVDDEYGLGIDSITMNISLPDEITQAMTRGVAKGVEASGFTSNMGDMQRYQQAMAAQAMVDAAGNPGGGAMGQMMGAGMGAAMGAAMAGQAAGSLAGAPAGTPPPLPGGKTFHVAVNGQQQGPYTLDQLRSAGLTPTTMVWSAGMADWAAASSVPELGALFQAPPPLPPQAPPAPPAAP